MRSCFDKVISNNESTKTEMNCLRRSRTIPLQINDQAGAGVPFVSAKPQLDHWMGCSLLYITLFPSDHPQVLFVEALFVFLLIGVFCYAVHWTDFHALGFVEMPYTFGAKRWIDFIDCFALGDRPVWAFGFADIAIDAFVGNKQGHATT